MNIKDLLIAETFPNYIHSLIKKDDSCMREYIRFSFCEYYGCLSDPRILSDNDYHYLKDLYLNTCANFLSKDSEYYMLFAEIFSKIEYNRNKQQYYIDKLFDKKYLSGILDEPKYNKYTEEYKEKSWFKLGEDYDW